MVFLSSQIKLEDLPDTKEKFSNYGWFLFSIMIQSKDIRHDDELCNMYNRLTCYPFVHTETLFNYLMSDNYYFKSNLYSVLKNTAEIICMRKINNFEFANDKKTLIPEEKRKFDKEDIYNMFDFFKRNNFRENPICQYVLSSKNRNQ